MRNRFAALLALTAVAVLADSPAAMGCPGCQTVLTPTLSEQLAEADVAVLARWDRALQASADGKRPARTDFTILQVARNNDKLVKKGGRISLPKHIEGEQGLLCFLTGKLPASKKKTAGDDKSTTIDWSDPTEVSEMAYSYITQAPSPETPAPKRLKFFLQFFEFPDPLVADDAYNEFAKAEFKDVRAAADAFPRKKLREWLTDEKTPQNHIGLYGIMLGLCGTKEDAPLLEKMIRKSTTEFRTGIEGVIAGYLMLVGEKGMDLIDRTKLADENVPFGETYMAIQGLRIMWTYGDGRVSRDRLKQSMRRLLDRPRVAELILPDLARWNDWAVMSRVMKLYDQKEYDTPGFKQAAIRYLIAASKDVPKDSTGDDPPHVAAAKKHLEVIKQKDPKNYRGAVRLLF